MKSFKPELLLISAGFDALAGDLIGNFALKDSDFAKLTRICMNIADEYCDGRIVSTLEGGYSLTGLSSASGAHASTLSTAT